MKNSEITIELKHGVTAEQADKILRTMLSVLAEDQLDLIENAHITCLVASVEKKLQPQKHLDEFKDELDKP